MQTLKKSFKVGAPLIILLITLNGCSLYRGLFKTAEKESKARTEQKKVIDTETVERIEAFIPGDLFMSLINPRYYVPAGDTVNTRPDSAGERPAVNIDKDAGGVTITVERRTDKKETVNTETVEREESKKTVEKESKTESRGLFGPWGIFVLGAAVVVALVIFLKFKIPI